MFECKIPMPCTCKCRNRLQFIASTEPLTGIHGTYSTDAGKFTFYAQVTCDACGAVYEPGHSRFSAYYNEANHRIRTTK